MMISRFCIPLLLAIVLAGCATHPELAEASGALRPLNAGRWTPALGDLRGAREPLPPSLSPSLDREGIE
ncbi:Outer membrane lipoprotein virB7 precursor [Agrobacterium rosae]|uniref:Outer membrane lipoprotein virB7 n=1 Tax=Agrobacterium rosae TaxID=1972867 RepID=A0A1R3U4P5_9HYPH|nr:Outer membrane lipoprotein virB7 precursor [Agrobacterium rosae]